MSHKELKEMKKLKWRDKSVADLQEEMRKTKSRTFDLRMDKATGKLNNFRDVLLNRKRIALLQTLIREKQPAGAGKEAK
ncbi:MAG: 50S ribosomal protein L29 [bacterium]|nr:50S ribosomal protein L29 [bacterium]